MVKTSSMVYKTLVVGVIVLFIGVGIQPAIAVTPNTADSEEECNLCPKVSNLHLVLLERMLNRVETLTSKLSVVSKLNPLIEEKSQVLSDAITTFKEKSNEFKFERPLIIRRILCGIAFTIYSVVWLIGGVLSLIPGFDEIIWPIMYATLVVTALICEPF